MVDKLAGTLRLLYMLGFVASLGLFLAGEKSMAGNVLTASVVMVLLSAMVNFFSSRRRGR